MRTFTCVDCKHTWTLPFGVGGRGMGLSCPSCGSANVHRTKVAQDAGHRARRRAIADSDGETARGIGRGRGFGRFRWGRR
jgi:hypothetical protein